MGFDPGLYILGLTGRHSNHSTIRLLTEPNANFALIPNSHRPSVNETNRIYQEWHLVLISIKSVVLLIYVRPLHVMHQASHEIPIGIPLTRHLNVLMSHEAISGLIKITCHARQPGLLLTRFLIVRKSRDTNWSHWHCAFTFMLYVTWGTVGS